MFSVELTFKVAGRMVPLDEFVDAVLAKSLAKVRDEVQGMRSIPQPGVARVVERAPEERAVGIERAAKLVGLSPATIRKYVAERTLHAVRIGRRVLIPMETINKILQEGLAARKE